jgi:hypothetical protein
MRTEVVRDEVLRLVKRNPFQPFSLNMENGERIVIEHPENLAFDPTNGTGKASSKFAALSQGLSNFGTFSAVSSVALLDTEGDPEG